jgi:hypothetical protein
MDFIRALEVITQKYKYILDLIFSNISIIYTLIRANLYYSSGYKTQVTIISR